MEHAALALKRAETHDVHMQSPLIEQGRFAHDPPQIIVSSPDSISLSLLPANRKRERSFSPSTSASFSSEMPSSKRSNTESDSWIKARETEPKWLDRPKVDPRTPIDLLAYLCSRIPVPKAPEHFTAEQLHALNAPRATTEESLTTFAVRLARKMKLSTSDVLIAASYLDRPAIKAVRKGVGRVGLPALVFRKKIYMASLMTAQKFHQDALFTNHDWAKISGFPRKDVNLVELDFFRQILVSNAYISPEAVLKMGIRYESWVQKRAQRLVRAPKGVRETFIQSQPGHLDTSCEGANAA